MLKVRLNLNEEKEKLEGFPWIFNNEIHSFDGEIENGKVCIVETFSHQFVGYGFFKFRF